MQTLSKTLRDVLRISRSPYFNLPSPVPNATTRKSKLLGVASHQFQQTLSRRTKLSTITIRYHVYTFLMILIHPTFTGCAIIICDLCSFYGAWIYYDLLLKAFSFLYTFIFLLIYWVLFFFIIPWNTVFWKSLCLLFDVLYLPPPTLEEEDSLIFLISPKTFLTKENRILKLKSPDFPVRETWANIMIQYYQSLQKDLPIGIC